MNPEKQSVPDSGMLKKSGIPVGMPKPPPEPYQRKDFTPEEWAAKIEAVKKMADQAVEDSTKDPFNPQLLSKVATVMNSSAKLGLSAESLLKVDLGKNPIQHYRELIRKARDAEDEKIKSFIKGILVQPREKAETALLLKRVETVLSKITAGEPIRLAHVKAFLEMPKASSSDSRHAAQ